jgi:hypothetical protein
MACGGVAMAMANGEQRRTEGGGGAGGAIRDYSPCDSRPETKDQGPGCQDCKSLQLTTHSFTRPPRPKTQIATSRAVSRFSSYLAAKRPKT